MRKFSFLYILSLFLFFSKSPGQGLDSAGLNADSIISSDALSRKKSISSLEKIFSRNTLLINQSILDSKISIQRKYSSSNLLFYIVFALIFFLAIIKSIYDKYFSNLLRVFFQTSLRQSQLTDQLMQAGLPSLLMNIFFVLSAALYISLLITRHYRNLVFDWKLFGYLSIVLTLIYLLKYLSLQFTGWITGFKKEAEAYTFIVFLINKIIALALLPLLIFMAFSENELVNIAIYSSYLLIGILFSIRFLRSLSLVQYRLSLNSLHFFLYITGVELMPILIICKAAVVIFSKNL